MDKIHSIRQLYYEQGKTIPEIITETGHDRKTITKYLDMTDFNAPEPVTPDPEGICPKLEPYKDNRSYHIGYKKAKNPDTYFRRYESQIILYGGARRMLEQAGINLKGLNVDKLKAEYQELMKQKSELTSTYKDCEKEVRELKRKQENLNQYLGRTQPDPAQDQQEKKDTPNL